MQNSSSLIPQPTTTDNKLCCFCSFFLARPLLLACFQMLCFHVYADFAYANTVTLAYPLEAIYIGFGFSLRRAQNIAPLPSAARFFLRIIMYSHSLSPMARPRMMRWTYGGYPMCSQLLSARSARPPLWLGTT